MKLSLVLPLFSLLAIPASAGEPPAPAKNDLLELTGRVRVLFEQRCNECHGQHLLKPEGKFGYVLDLQGVADNSDYIERGAPAKSELFRLLKEQEMPPNDQTKFAKLKLGELDLVRRWILAGAPSKLPAILPRPAVTSNLASVLNADAIAGRERARQKLISIEARRRPTGEILAEIAKRSGIPIEHDKPEREPLATIVLKDGSLFDAVQHSPCVEISRSPSNPAIPTSGPIRRPTCRTKSDRCATRPSPCLARRSGRRRLHLHISWSRGRQPRPRSSHKRRPDAGGSASVRPAKLTLARVVPPRA